MQILAKHYTAEKFLQDYEILKSKKRILNAGSSSLRYGENCINVDIQKKPNVDFVCDIHEIPDS